MSTRLESRIAQTHKYPALDALRGAAALSVMVHHFGEWVHGGLFPRGYLAVDLFFILSGFVIANAYEHRLRESRRIGWFIRVRIIRLFPLYILGSLMGLAVMALRRKVDLPFYAYLPALLLLPTLWGVEPYPLDGPAWSLGLEFWGNLIYAKAAPILDNKRVRLWIGAGAVMVIAAAIKAHGLNVGWSIHTFPSAIGRFCFGFLSGVAMQRLDARGKLRLPQLNPWIAIGAITALMSAPSIKAIQPAYDSAVVLLAFPLLVGASIRPRMDRGALLFARYAGGISYALYLTHILFKKHLLMPMIENGAPPLQTMAGMIVLALATATVAHYAFDEPVRRRLAAIGWPGSFWKR